MPCGPTMDRGSCADQKSTKRSFLKHSNRNLIDFRTLCGDVAKNLNPSPQTIYAEYSHNQPSLERDVFYKDIGGMLAGFVAIHFPEGDIT